MAVVSMVDMVIYFLLEYCTILSGKIATDAYYILTSGSLQESLYVLLFAGLHYCMFSIFLYMIVRLLYSSLYF